MRCDNSNIEVIKSSTRDDQKSQLNEQKIVPTTAKDIFSTDRCVEHIGWAADKTIIYWGYRTRVKSSIQETLYRIWEM